MLRAASIVMVLAMAIAACGDDDDGGDAAVDSTTATTANGDGSNGSTTGASTGDGHADDAIHGDGSVAWEAAVSGDPVAADQSADPVVLSFSNLEGAAAGSFPEVREGLEAAVKEINEQLGGIDGRPVELEICVHGLDPNEATNCANQIVDADPSLHINGVEFLSPVVYPVLLGNGIPIVTAVPILVADTDTDGVFSPNQGCVAFVGDARYMVEEQGHDRIAVISALPLGPQCYNDITKRALDVMALEHDVRFEVFEHQAGDPSDDAAMVQAIDRFLDGAENAAVFFPEQASDCNEHLNGLAGAGVDAGLYMADACNDESVLANPNAAGSTFAIVDYTPELAEGDAFIQLQLERRDAALDALPVEAPRGSFMSRGYRTGILAWTVLNRLAAEGGDVDDPAAVMAALGVIENTFSIGSPPIDCVNAAEEYSSVCLNATTFGTWNGQQMEFPPPRNGEFRSYLDVLDAMETNAPREAS